MSSFYLASLTAPFDNTWTLKFKTQLTIVFFTAVNHYDDNQRTTKKRNKQKLWIKIYQSQSTDVTFWTRCSELLFPKRSA